MEVKDSNNLFKTTKFMNYCVRNRNYDEFPFGIGCMKFDDFNYKFQNEQILKSKN